MLSMLSSLTHQPDRPNDLASSMGFVSHEHPNIPEVQEAIKRVLAASKAAGKYAGMVRQFHLALLDSLTICAVLLDR